MPKRLMPKVDASNMKSVFLLGLFSGAATSCCAPVLAGAITLAVISGVFWKALIVALAYVFGMTFPLFIAAYLYDRFKIENSKFIKGKLLEIRLGSKTYFIHSTNLVAGLVFFVMGVTLLALAFSGNFFWAPGFQVSIGNALNAWSQKALDLLTEIPEIVWSVVIIGIFLFLLYKIERKPRE